MLTDWNGCTLHQHVWPASAHVYSVYVPAKVSLTQEQPEVKVAPSWPISEGDTWPSSSGVITLAVIFSHNPGSQRELLNNGQLPDPPHTTHWCHHIYWSSSYFIDESGGWYEKLRKHIAQTLFLLGNVSVNRYWHNCWQKLQNRQNTGNLTGNPDWGGGMRRASVLIVMAVPPSATRLLHDSTSIHELRCRLAASQSGRNRGLFPLFLCFFVAFSSLYSTNPSWQGGCRIT